MGLLFYNQSCQTFKINLMPEDFFADGFGQEQGVIFTKQQDQFLQKKLVFLDSQKTYQIPIAKALNLLKYTRLGNQVTMKILQNSCSNGIGQKFLTYDEMKKIFRGVALKQNKMEPSKINIQANIKTKMPIFYDEDDDDDQQPQQENRQIKQKYIQPPKQLAPQIISQTYPTNQPPQPPKAQGQIDPLKGFDQYWKNLKTKNNLIEGNEVKKLFSNNNLNKSNLSKAWKLCNNSEKGYLTKGEFFIFMNLINSTNIPDALTTQMKQCIAKIQQACGYKKNGVKQSEQKKEINVNPSQKSKQRKISETFEKFTDQNLFAKKSSKVQDPSKNNPLKNSSVLFPPSQINLGLKSNITPPSNQLPAEGKNKSALLLLQKVEIMERQQRQIEKIAENNAKLISGLGSIEQYLSVVERNLQLNSNKIQILKQNQNTLNQRLNNVCLKFKDIISKQSDCIKFLMDNMSIQSQSSLGRLQVLEAYTQQMISIVDSNVQVSKNAIIKIQHQKNVYFQQVKSSNQILKQKISSDRSRKLNQQSPLQKQQHKNFGAYSPEIPYYGHSDPFQDHQNQQEPNKMQYQPNIKVQIPKNNPNTITYEELPTNIPSTQKNLSIQESASEQGHIYFQNLSPEERKKTKQMLLIKILNSVSSMSQEQYTTIVNKVISMTDEQMNQSYTKLHALYLQTIAKSGISQKYTVPSPEQFSAPYFY